MVKVINILQLFCFLSFSIFNIDAVKADDPTPEEIHLNEMLNLRFDSKYTHAETKNKFLTNLSRDCKKFGYGKIVLDERISSLAILETYPKEIALKYFRENYKNLCYYGFSLGVKYLLNDYKSKLDPIVNTTIMDCFRRKNPKNTEICKAIEFEYFYADITPVLSSLCTRSSFNTFKKLYCEYTEVKKKKCSYYSKQSYQKCPEYQSHRVDIDSLYKQFFNASCKRFKWRKPKC